MRASICIKKYIAMLMFLLLFAWSCKKQETGLSLSEYTVEYTEIKESYLGETNILTIKSNGVGGFSLYVDGKEVAFNTDTIRYDFAELPLGTHTIKIKFSTPNDETFEKSFSCKIIEKPIVYELPKLSCHPVTESYVGESSVITATTDNDSKITLFVDGVETKTSDTKSLYFDVSGLTIGTHKIKIVSVNGDKKDQKEFECNIIGKPIVYEVPKLSCSPVTESYVGESAAITASTDIDSKITLFVDGEETKATDTKSLSFDVSGLTIGIHRIKIVAVNGDKSDKIEFDCNIIAKPNKHEFVDLGLPSGLLWATCNVGAENPWDYGDYFAWGETEPKDDYSWESYKYCMGTAYSMTKYCNEGRYANYGYNGFTDNLTSLEPKDDAATANWGSDCRMPTKEEYKELTNNCVWQSTSDYKGTGIAGWVVQSRINSKSIFLPCAGYRGDENFYEIGEGGGYWSSSLDTSEPYLGEFLFSDVYLGIPFTSGEKRFFGQSVRPVRNK